MKRLQIRVYGRPAPQGSKRHVGRGIMVESSKHVAPWRALVTQAARTAIEADPEFKRFEGPVRYRMVFIFPRPKKPKNRRWVMTAPDLSKLQRSTEDALTDAGVWRDDCLVCEAVAGKIYPYVDAPMESGAIISIEEFA